MVFRILDTNNQNSKSDKKMVIQTNADHIFLINKQKPTRNLSWKKKITHI